MSRYVESAAGTLMQLRSPFARYKAGGLPDDIYRELIGDLYGPLQTVVIGGLSVTLVGGYVTWRSGSAWLGALTVAMAVVSGARLVFFHIFRKGDLAARAIQELQRWEMFYLVSTSLFTALVGALSFVAVAFADDTVSQLLIVSLAIGYTVGVTRRSASRPLVAVVQLLLTLVPVITASLMRLDLAYLVLAMIGLLYFLAMVEIITYHAAARMTLLTTSRELTRSNLHFDAAISNMSHGLCMLDSEQRVIVWNKRFCEINNLPENALRPGATIREVVEQSVAAGHHPGRAVTDVVADYQGHLVRGLESKRQLPDGRIIAMSNRSMADGGIVCLFEDVTERERVIARVRHLSTHDDLTGLPNRMRFRQILAEDVSTSHTEGGELAVLFIDLDSFKFVNDTLGHAAGDDLLRQVALRLKACLRENDVLARLGGDEFIVLLRTSTDREFIDAIAQKLLAAAAKPVLVDEQQCHVTASIGISVYPDDAADEESLIRNADTAMYIAKQQGRNNHCYYAGKQDAESMDALVRRLRGASAKMGDAGAPDRSRKTK